MNKIDDAMLERMRSDMAGVPTESGDNLADILVRLAEQRAEEPIQRGVGFRRAQAVPAPGTKEMDKDKDEDESGDEKDKALTDYQILAKAIDGLATQVSHLLQAQAAKAQTEAEMQDTLDDVAAQTTRISEALTGLIAYTPRPSKTRETEIDPDDQHAAYLRKQNATPDGQGSLLEQIRKGGTYKPPPAGFSSNGGSETN